MTVEMTPESKFTGADSDADIGQLSPLAVGLEEADPPQLDLGLPLSLLNRSHSWTSGNPGLQLELPAVRKEYSVYR